MALGALVKRATDFIKNLFLIMKVLLVKDSVSILAIGALVQKLNSVSLMSQIKASVKAKTAL